VAEGNFVQTDRLGSVRSGGPGGLGYQAQYPYGVEYTPQTVNDREKYATYTRDSVTGLDYAMNRYYSSQWGRFLSPDPSGGSVAPGNPQSWNRYGYAANDPANRADPTGLLYTAQDCINNPDACVASDQGWGDLGSPGPDGLPCGFGYGTVCGILDGDPGPICIAAPGSPFAPTRTDTRSLFATTRSRPRAAASDFPSGDRRLYLPGWHWADSRRLDARSGVPGPG